MTSVLVLAALAETVPDVSYRLCSSTDRVACLRQPSIIRRRRRFAEFKVGLKKATDKYRRADREVMALRSLLRLGMNKEWTIRLVCCSQPTPAAGRSRQFEGYMDKEEDLSLGMLLKRYRNARGFTVGNVAELSGVKTTNLAWIEYGKTWPRRDTLSKIVLSLNLTEDERNAVWDAYHVVPRGSRRPLPDVQHGE